MRGIKRLTALAVAGMMAALLFTGCDGNTDLMKGIQAGDREYGKTYTAEGTEGLQTSFFQFNINESTLKDEVDGYILDDDTQRFLVVNITVKNTFEGDDPSIPMFDVDFTVSWEGLNGIYPEDEFAEGQLPAEYEIFKGKSRTGDLIFVVPEDVTDFVLSYTEEYEDDFEGNTFEISFTPGEDTAQAA